MAKRSKVYPAEVPSMPLRPSRGGMSRRTRTRLSFVMAGTIAAIVAAAVLLAAFGRSENLLPVGTTAPAFALPEGARGHAYLLEFCSTWSSPCAVQTRALNQLALRSPVVSVNADSEDAASVAAFRRFHDVRYPILVDPGEKTVHFPTHGPRGPIASRYHVTHFPTVYVVDSAGRIAWRATGVKSRAFLAQKLREAILPE
jgi:hypothetical protein